MTRETSGWRWRAALAAVSMLLTACSTGYDGKWRAATGPTPRDPYSGRWTGEWRSTRGTHKGGLECVFTKAGANLYRADFHAHWHGLSSAYTVPFKTHRAGDRLSFQGEHDLGAVFGGNYRYRGEVSATQFSAKYDSRYDSGFFDLHRP